MRIDGGGREIDIAEAQKWISDLFGTDIGEIDGFLIAAHRPEDDSYVVGGSLSCQHCRAGFLTESALRILADAPHEHHGVVSIDITEQRENGGR